MTQLLSFEKRLQKQRVSQPRHSLTLHPVHHLAFENAFVASLDEAVTMEEENFYVVRKKLREDRTYILLWQPQVKARLLHTADFIWIGSRVANRDMAVAGAKHAIRLLSTLDLSLPKKAKNTTGAGYGGGEEPVVVLSGTSMPLAFQKLLVQQKAPAVASRSCVETNARNNASTDTDASTSTPSTSTSTSTSTNTNTSTSTTSTTPKTTPTTPEESAESKRPPDIPSLSLSGVPAGAGAPTLGLRLPLALPVEGIVATEEIEGRYEEGEKRCVPRRQQSDEEQRQGENEGEHAREPTLTCSSSDDEEDRDEKRGPPAQMYQLTQAKVWEHFKIYSYDDLRQHCSMVVDVATNTLFCWLCRDDTRLDTNALVASFRQQHPALCPADVRVVAESEAHETQDFFAAFNSGL